jgi:hypothetical protein
MICSVPLFDSIWPQNKAHEIFWFRALFLIKYLIFVGKALSPEKSASCAPCEKSSSRWVRLGQR